MITIAAPDIGVEEIDAVNGVLRSGMLAKGPKVDEFEAAFAAYCGTKFAVSVNSGTAAIHSALYAAGVRAGDEVITVPFSFVATINPILMQGAIPKLVDIEPKTFNMDVSKVEAAISSKTKAIIPVHLFGQPAEMDQLQALADKHGLKIIEDACQAVGATYKSVKAGNLGDLGCFSLYATKNIMCGEGGIVTTNDEEYARLIRQFRQHGMTAQYDYADIGYNYRMSDLHAAIAVEQLKKADSFNVSRQHNAQVLSQGLSGLEGLELPNVADDNTHVYHQYTIRITPAFRMGRDEFVKYLRDHEIGAAVYYAKPLHAFKHIAKYGYGLGDFPVAEQASAEVVSLPVHPKVSDKDLQQIIKAIKAAAHGE